MYINLLIPCEILSFNTFLKVFNTFLKVFGLMGWCLGFALYEKVLLEGKTLFVPIVLIFSYSFLSFSSIFFRILKLYVRKGLNE